MNEVSVSVSVSITVVSVPSLILHLERWQVCMIISYFVRQWAIPYRAIYIYIYIYIGLYHIISIHSFIHCQYNTVAYTFYYNFLLHYPGSIDKWVDILDRSGLFAVDRSAWIPTREWVPQVLSRMENFYHWSTLPQWMKSVCMPICIPYSTRLVCLLEKIKRRFFWQETLLSESWGSSPFRPWMNHMTHSNKKVCTWFVARSPRHRYSLFLRSWPIEDRHGGPFTLSVVGTSLTIRVVCGQWLFLYKIAHRRGGTVQYRTRLDV